jgi:ankyrin repeat protein
VRRVILLILSLLPGCRELEPGTALSAAAAQGLVGETRRLLAAGADPDEIDGHGMSALGYAARAGAAEVVPVLVAAGADADRRDRRSTGWTPLMHALHKGQRSAVLALLASGASPEAAASGLTPLRMAAGYGDAAMVRALLERGADPRASGQELLADAVGGAWDIDYRWVGCAAHTEVVRLLLDRAPDLRVADTFRGRAAIRHAQRRGCTEMLERLRRPA